MARAWRAFAAQRKTTHQLVVNFVKCGISGESIWSACVGSLLVETVPLVLRMALC
jgi:hypothetical protein